MFLLHPPFSSSWKHYQTWPALFVTDCVSRCYCVCVLNCGAQSHVLLMFVVSLHFEPQLVSDSMFLRSVQSIHEVILCYSHMTFWQKTAASASQTQSQFHLFSLENSKWVEMKSTVPPLGLSRSKLCGLKVSLQESALLSALMRIHQQKPGLDAQYSIRCKRTQSSLSASQLIWSLVCFCSEDVWRCFKLLHSSSNLVNSY